MDSNFHIKNWIEDILNSLFPIKLLSIFPTKIEKYIWDLFQKTLIFFRIVRKENNFSLKNIQMRTALFIKEAKKRRIDFFVLKSFFGYTNYFFMKVKEKDYFFEGLPRFEFKSRPIIKIVDDKYLVKKILKREKFPVLDGKSFWFFQKRKAINFAINLGFPLVVKPRSGSLSEAVTCNIKDKKFLAFAISRAISYSPTFIVEKYLPNSYVFRATVIDFDKIFCVKQIPANIVGDGTHDIKELIEIKNNNSKRGEMSQKTILKKIIVNDVTKKLLEEKNYTFLTIPQKREIVFLQKDSFLKLGGDLVEVTNSIHPDNLSLFSEIARLFDIRIVGIDFLAKDISLSWKNQESTILELNSLPAIEMHYFPTIGKKQNVASSIVKMTLKYLKD